LRYVQPAIHAVKLATEVEEEDDLSPLRNALEKAQSRAERLTQAREQEENAALEIAELAIAERDKLEQAKKAVSETEHMLHKRERQVSQLKKQREPLEAQVEKSQQTDVLASVDGPSDSSPASTGALWSKPSFPMV
jgi:predicted nuclease with TOPRIM domain